MGVVVLTMASACQSVHCVAVLSYVSMQTFVLNHSTLFWPVDLQIKKEGEALMLR